MSYMPGQAAVTDLNGDGQPEAWITERNLYCYGNTGSAFMLLTREGTGWHLLLDEVGMPLQLGARHDGWPDIEVGGQVSAGSRCTAGTGTTTRWQNEATDMTKYCGEIRNVSNTTG